jgi:hypothetical protein
MRTPWRALVLGVVGAGVAAAAGWTLVLQGQVTRDQEAVQALALTVARDRALARSLPQWKARAQSLAREEVFARAPTVTFVDQVPPVAAACKVTVASVSFAAATGAVRQGQLYLVGTPSAQACLVAYLERYPVQVRTWTVSGQMGTVTLELGG